MATVAVENAKETVFDIIFNFDSKVKCVEYYRLVLHGLDIDVTTESPTFIELFETLRDCDKLKGHLGDAVSLTCVFMRNFESIYLADLEQYETHDFSIEYYPGVDLRLTIAKFLRGLTTTHDRRLAMTYISSENKDLRIPQFVQVICEREIVKVDDISKLSGNIRRLKPAIIDSYLERHPEAKQNFPGNGYERESGTRRQETLPKVPESTVPKTKLVLKPPQWDKESSLPKIKSGTAFTTALVEDIKVLLMTATDDEEEGVLNYMEPKDGDDSVIQTRIDNDSGIILHIGKYGNNPVIVVKSAESKCSQGSVHAAVVLTIVLRECKSIKYVISVGVCFGMKNDQSFASINISDIVCDFTTERIGNDRHDSFYRGPQFVIRPAILGRFKAMSLPLPTEPKYEVKVQKGPLISSNKLVNNLDCKAGMLDERRDALAAEMEGAGIMSATQYAGSIDAVIIKAIGDWGDGNKDHCRGWKPFAARAAAYYVKEMLSSKETFN